MSKNYGPSPYCTVTCEEISLRTARANCSGTCTEVHEIVALGGVFEQAPPIVWKRFRMCNSLIDKHLKRLCQ